MLTSMLKGYFCCAGACAAYRQTLMSCSAT